MESRRALSLRLLAGLAVILTAATVYSAYTAVQLRSLRRMLVDTVDRNRMDSALLLRIQNDLNGLGLAMRDMQDPGENYPLTAWQGQLNRLRSDLDDAIGRERKFAPAARTATQSEYLASSAAQFWDAADRIFELAKTDEKEARARIRLSLQARQEALGTAVARLLVQNNESEEQSAAQTQAIYSRVERNLYLFFAALLAVVLATSAYLLHYNRRVFDQVTSLSERRSELARQLIATQESTLRSISRELHDDFGQILTAVGLMLQRASKRADDGFKRDLREVHETVQTALDKVRSLSQALHPVTLEEVGLQSALDIYIPQFASRTGIQVEYRKSGAARELDGEVAIHTYRIVQEALNNVARHAKSDRAHVRLNLTASSLVLEVEDAGVGMAENRNKGLGLVSMRERAEIMKGAVEVLPGPGGVGTLVRLTVPVPVSGEHATVA